jgi:hypothetical protein
MMSAMVWGAEGNVKTAEGGIIAQRSTTLCHGTAPEQRTPSSVFFGG